MMQGDQYKLPIELKDSDGTFVTREEVRDLEVFVGTVRKMLSKGEVEFEPLESIFYVSLSQKETFMMRGDVSVQARVLFLSSDVVGVYEKFTETFLTAETGAFAKGAELDW